MLVFHSSHVALHSMRPWKLFQCILEGFAPAHSRQFCLGWLSGGPGDPGGFFAKVPRASKSYFRLEHALETWGDMICREVQEQPTHLMRPAWREAGALEKCV